MTAVTSSTARFVRELDVLIRARYPLLYLVTYEEQRVEALLGDLARAHSKELYEWSLTRGLREVGRGDSKVEDTEEPRRVLAAVAELKNPSLVILKDFHRFLDDVAITRALRELCQLLKNRFTTVLICAPVLKIPDELEKEMTVVDVPLPDREDLMQLVKGVAAAVSKNRRVTVQLGSADVEALVSAAHGLTLGEAENAFAKAIAKDGRLDGSDVKLILEEKTQVVRKSGLLEYSPSDQSLADVGGLGNVKAWLNRRSGAFTAKAREFGLPEPKGLLLIGVQGCGKSLSARAIAGTWRLPLLRLDMGRIYSGLIGSSEENVRRALKTAESLAPVVLWIDEIEKGLASSIGEGGGDSGVSARVFGTMLTWFQEKTAPVFVVATANRVDRLPPELLRKGRFDEVFFVDLPNAEERSNIFEIQLRKRGREPSAFACETLAVHAEGFSGAEIEQVVISSLYDAFADGQPLTVEHLHKSIAETVPLSVTMAEDVRSLREWAKHRSRQAS